ncbi:MAG TPA: SUMF1/EgtB/PvdO family nonheme iron enzyme [Pirellulales bacterium]|nr:SUMF1/EgtB/PvdO family nonheme iron enzyme [Pirellulales bacterium]
MNADRNLLFGILAFQLSFIDRRALLAAFDQWTADKNKPLGEILVELGDLDVSRRQLLDALVAEHIKLHGGDAEKSLAAVSSLGSIRKDLEQIADPDLRASLAGAAARPPDEGAPVDPYATIPPSAGTRTSSGMRFTILRAHAKGGLGQVSVALDEELNREVAFKEIQDKYADDAVSRSRFLLEAEVTGGLEHPGIVPVYGLGQYGDGRPFYAMRFIRGDSLQAAIKRFHDAQASGGRKPPVTMASGGRKPPVSLIGERAVQFRKLLGRFIDVCNAMEYAHSRGVLHRDLKPGNIMLGKYGETLVVDWGLAKSLGHSDSQPESDEPRLRPSSGGDHGHTQMGSAIGTPQYMSPEQATGRLDQLGPATDVYRLGATLYCLLTGRAPFLNADLGNTLEQVSKGEFPPPRTIKKDVPPALQAICLKAMALKPTDRYASARALADDIERWIADEPILVYREPLRRRVRRWVRNHKGTAGAAAAAALVLIVGGFVASTTARRANQRTQNITRAEGLVESLGKADTQQVPEVLKQLGPYEEWAKPLLERKVAQAKEGSTEKLHLSLALVEGDVESDVESDGGTVENHVEYLYEQLLGAEPARFAVIRDALANHSPRISDRLWTVLTGRESDPNQQRLRAAGALAKYDPANARWTEVAPEVANQLVSVNPVFVGQWQEALRPVAEKLLRPLARIFINPEQGELPRTLATSLLADYAKGDPDTLTNLLIDADSKAFGTVFPVLQPHGAAAVEKLQAVLDRKVAPTWNDQPLDRSHHAPRDGSITRSVMSTVEAAHGMVDERFAFCQDLAWEEFRQLAESLRPSGYRPMRVRPWGTDDKPLVAAVWARDGKRWELETDLGQDQLPKPDAPAEKDGLVPADLAVLPSVDPAVEPPGVSGGGRRFVLLWGEPAAADEERRLVVGAGEQELLASQAAMVKQGFAAQSAVGVWTDAAGQRRYLGIWSNQGAPSELRLAYGGFELVDQPQWDVAVAPAARLADPLDARRRQLADIAKLPPAQWDQPQVRLTRATAQYHVGQWEAALADLDFLIEKKVASPELLQYRAWTLARLGKAEEARAELAKYLEQAKDPSTRAYVQVVLAAWLGEHDQAAELLDAAAKAAAANADGLYNAACAAAMASQACAASDAPRAAALLGRAIELVEAAVAQGYKNTVQLRTDVDLAGLHGDPQFLALVDRLEPPARYAAIWRADIEFESRLLGPSSLESQLEQARELAAQGYRPVAIAAFDERSVAGLARVRGVANPTTVGILTNSATVAGLARVRDAQATPDAGILANPATAEILANPATPQSEIRNPQSAILTASVWQRPLVPDAAKEELALRQATAAAALLRMGESERVWPLLEHQPDPRLRSYLLDRLAPYGADPATVLAQLQTEPDVSRRRALILAIGQFARATLLSAEQHSTAATALANWYADDPDAGIHAAAEWSLRQLGAQAEIAQVRQAHATGSVVGERQWYLTKEGGQTLVIMRPEGDFLMGSPTAEAERFRGPTGKNEIRHRRRIGRTYAIGAHEVTVEQFQRFRADHEFDRTKAREPDAPANMVSWYDAAAFCNWLSEREEIARDQWCYDPDQKFAEGMALYPDYLQRAGYRLPSEAEWEYACRAGAMTARYFGETDRLLGQYAWFTKNSLDRWMLPVGSLKPNDFGLFDANGNALEWCQDVALLYLKDRAWMEDKEQMGNVSNSQSRVLRGGAFFLGATHVRSALPGYFQPVYRNNFTGFRVARTYP